MTQTDRKRTSSGTRLQRLSLLPKLMVGKVRKQPESAESQTRLCTPEWPLQSNTPVDIQSAYPALSSSRDLASPRSLSANSTSPIIFHVGTLERLGVPESATRGRNRASWGMFLSPKNVAAHKSAQQCDMRDQDAADEDRVMARVEARLSAIQGDKSDFFPFPRGKAAQLSPQALSSSESWDGDRTPRPTNSMPVPTVSTPREQGRHQNRHTAYLDMTFGSKTLGNVLLLKPEPSEQGRIMRQEATVLPRAVSDSVVTITYTKPMPCHTQDSFSRCETSSAMLPVPSVPEKQTSTHFLDPTLLFFVPRSKSVAQSDVVTRLADNAGYHEDKAAPVGATLCVPTSATSIPGSFELEATPLSPCGSDRRSRSSPTLVSPLEHEPGDTFPGQEGAGPPEAGLGQQSAPSSIYSADESTLVDGGEEETGEAVVGSGLHKDWTLTRADPWYDSAIKARIMMESPTGNAACDAWLVRSRMFQLGGSPIVTSSPVHEIDRFLSPALVLG